MISPSWKVSRDHPASNHTMRLRFSAGNKCLSYGDFLQALEADTSFREIIQDEMRAAPFVAFRWEAPPLTLDNLDRPFECLLHDSPGLDVPADPTDFRSYFQAVSLLNIRSR